MNKITDFLNRHTIMLYSMTGVCVLCIFLLPYGKRLFDQIPDYEWETGQMGDVKSKEPFGAKYLDEYLHEYWKGQIYVENDVDSALQKYGKRRANYLVIRYENYYTESANIANYIKKANVGNNILFAGNNDQIIENLTINVYDDGYFDVRDFLRNPNDMKRISLYLKNMTKEESQQQNHINVWKNMANTSISSGLEQKKFYAKTEYFNCYGNIPVGTYTRLIAFSHSKDIAARRNIGRGHITLCPGTLFFTNYAVQDYDLRLGMEHIMRAAFNKKLPLVIIYDHSEKKNRNCQGQGYVFDVLLNHPATALFLWLLVAALLLAIFVNGRRRRRAEHKRERARNSSINYVRHLASLYTETTDYSELLRIEKQVLLYKLRKEYYFDMRTREFTKVSEFAGHIAAAKNIDSAHVKSVLTTLEELTDIGVQVDANSYRLCLKQLDELDKMV